MSIDQEADLIARLENATGPDRELDADIMYFEIERGTGIKVTRIPSLTETANHYTRSLDAALTLVPEGYSYELTQSAVEPPAFSRCRLWDWRRGPLAIDPGNEWKAEGNRPLTVNTLIACLRLRAALRAKEGT
jgi:hypothetical protein